MSASLNRPIDVRTLHPKSPTKIAHLMANGFNTNGTVDAIQTQSQHRVDNVLSNIPNSIKQKKTLQIQGVTEENADRLQRFGITLSSISENNKLLSPFKISIANLLSLRIKTTESTEEKQIDDLQQEKKFYIQDLLIAHSAQKSRLDLLTNKLAKVMTTKPHNVIFQVLQMLIIFDLRIIDIDISTRDRKSGVPNEEFKAMWKLLYSHDLDSSKLRSKTNVLSHLGTLYGIPSNQRQVLDDKSNDNYNLYGDNLAKLKKSDSKKGNGFIKYGNDKIKKVIEDLVLNGFKSMAINKNVKKKQDPSSDTSTEPTSNKLLNKKRKKRKRDYDNIDNSDSNDIFSPNSQAKIHGLSDKKTKHAQKHTFQGDTFGAFSLNDSPSKFTPSYYDAIPLPLKTLEGREVWTIQHHTNKFGFWCGDSFHWVILVGSRAKTLTIKLRFDAGAPRCIADIEYEMDELTMDDIKPFLSEELAESQNEFRIYVLPKRKEYDVILPLPEEFRNSLCNPGIKVNKQRAFIALIFKAQESKLFHIRNSLNSSLRFKQKNIGIELEQKFANTSFEGYLEQQLILENIDNLVSARDLWFYYQRQFEKTTDVPTHLNRKQDIIMFWQNKYENAPNWKKLMVQQTADREEAMKSNSAHRLSVLDTYSIDDETFEEKMTDKRINDERIEITENELEVNEWPTIHEFNCIICKVKIEELEWNEMKHKFCDKCAKRTWKRKQNIDLFVCDESQLQRDREIIAIFPRKDGNEEHHDVGSMYAKYVKFTNDGQEKHVISILFCNAKVPTIYYFNDPQYEQALKNTKLILKY